MMGWSGSGWTSLEESPSHVQGDVGEFADHTKVVQMHDGAAVLHVNGPMHSVSRLFGVVLGDSHMLKLLSIMSLMTLWYHRRRNRNSDASSPHDTS